MCLTLVVIMLCALALPASAALEADVRNSIVVVATCFDTGSGELLFGTGTGFFINDQYLVTNHHVVDTFLAYGEGELVTLYVNDVPLQGRATTRVYFDSTKYKEAYIVGYDEHKDLAIMRLAEPTQERAPLKLMSPTEDMVGSDIYAVGYPGLADNALTGATESMGKNDATVTKGSISRLLVQSGTGVRMVQIDCDIRHGNSGGPVVTSEGFVIGVATWSVSTTEVSGGAIEIEAMNYAINVEDVIELLNQYGVHYTLASTTPDPTEEVPTAEPDPKPDTKDIILIAVCAAAVLIIAALVIIIIKKKPAPAPAPTPAPAPAKRPVIRSQAPANYGVTASVGAQPVLIGRAPHCTLLFPAQAPGISASHCSVQWDPATGDFIVTDLNSTYGTFLMSGQKMLPHQPYRMRAGDKFYLAEQSNIIGLSLE